MQIAATSAIGCCLLPALCPQFQLNYHSAPRCSFSSLPSLLLFPLPTSLCVQPISGSKALNEPKSTAKCHQQQEQPVHSGHGHGQGGSGRKGLRRERGSQSGSLLKCCANFICKLWQKRGLYANLHCALWQGVVQRRREGSEVVLRFLVLV